MNEDEEDDYMSDAFLNKLEDVRPSLVFNRAQKRAIEVQNKQSENIKRQRNERLEKSGANLNERLQESLKKPIPRENKGFQLLAKMGYKPGQSLGKLQPQQPSTEVPTIEAASSRNKALIEPIGISVKADRGGLGREAALRDLAESRRRIRHQKLLEAAGAKETLTVEEFRRRATQKAEERFIKGALRRCQQTCMNLDTAENIEQPVELWFWPDPGDGTEKEQTDDINTEADEDAGAEEVEYSDAEKVELLTGYLRTAYTFCFWCGIRYKDVEELSTECPGSLRDDH